MQLKQLTDRIQVRKIHGPTSGEVSGLAYDSRRVKADTVFVAMKGEKADGNAYIDQAIAAGATAIVTEENTAHPRATTVVVENARAALADLACAYYRYPARRLKMAAITGTNGKTTTSFLLKHLCEAAQLRSGLFGTVRYEIGDRVIPASRTTPESLDLQEMLFKVQSEGGKAAVLEASSHALVQDRLRGIEFDVGVFTNLTQDHLDFHQTMDAYFEAKSRLFTGMLNNQQKEGKGVLNLDDRYGLRLLETFGKGLSLISYGLGVRADFRASNVKIDFTGTTYQLDANGRSYLVRLPLIGRFNVYNSLAALAAATAMGLDLRRSVQALAGAPAVPGRLQPVPSKRQFRVFVDYAHTDDALQNVMRTLRELAPSRLIVVFGCGGNRDRAKRPLMAAAAEQNADFTIVTSDNPRREQPEAIIEDIKGGFRNSAYEVIVDRRAAIYRAISVARARDIVLIAGKGHENYQEFADHTVPFDDVEMARRAIEETPVEMER
jgi:UDP-N-acetylmuramoyl-L-alanyl-D-glutamate--2,6-diaminopimelate ligase